MKNTTFVPVLLSTLLILGCSTVSTITGPDGTDHQLLSCRQIEDCYSEATKICGGKYKIVNTSSETSGNDGKTETETKLLIKCQK